MLHDSLVGMKPFFLFEMDCILRQAQRSAQDKFYDETVVWDEYHETGGPLRVRLFVDIQ